MSKRKSKKITKPRVKSNKHSTKIVKLGWSQTCKNYNTLKKIIKANQEEKEI